jgi:hypothetical protein
MHHLALLKMDSKKHNTHASVQKHWNDGKRLKIGLLGPSPLFDLMF